MTTSNLTRRSALAALVCTLLASKPLLAMTSGKKKGNKSTFFPVNADGTPSGKHLDFDCNAVDESRKVFRFSVHGDLGNAEVFLTKADGIRLINTLNQDISA